MTEPNPASVTCPKCGHHDTRPSHRYDESDALHTAQGLIPWRCRTCRNRFFAPHNGSGPVSSSAGSRGSERPRRRPRSPASRPRFVEAMVFLGMLVLFFLFLIFITRENSSSGGVGNPPNRDLVIRIA